MERRAAENALQHPSNTEQELNDIESQLRDLNSEINRIAMLTQMLQIGSRVNKGPAKPVHNQKSVKKADKLRVEGNEASAKDKDRMKALHLYTKSLAAAPPQSIAYAMAHANRSSVLRDMGFYLESIAEAQRALKANFLQQLTYKLYVRQGKCYRKIKEYGKAVKSFKLALQYLKNRPETEISAHDKEIIKIKIEMEIKCCGKHVVEEPLEDLTQDISLGVEKYEVPRMGIKVNPEVPAASNSIALKYNKQYGRHFVATRDIAPGRFYSPESHTVGSTN